MDGPNSVGSTCSILCKRVPEYASHRVGDRAPVEDRRLRPRENSVNFRQTFCPDSPIEYEYHNITTFEALQNICKGEPFYAYYGESYYISSLTHVKLFIFSNFL